MSLEEKTALEEKKKKKGRTKEEEDKRPEQGEICDTQMSNAGLLVRESWEAGRDWQQLQHTLSPSLSVNED